MTVAWRMTITWPGAPEPIGRWAPSACRPDPAQAGATFVIWLLAAWLIVAGLARIVFAVQMRQVIDGKWLLWLSGLVAIALGVWFFFNTQVGAVAIAWWLGIGALVYGVLQVAVAFYFRRNAAVIID